MSVIEGDREAWSKTNRMQRQIDALRSVFQKVVNMIAGRSIPLVVTTDPHGPPAPGWTDGSTIYLNRTYIDEALKSTTSRKFGALIMALKGLIYHELSHVKFTPTEKDSLSVSLWAREKSDGSTSGGVPDITWWYAFNGLEDQRIETLFTTAYPPAATYFTATVMQWIAKTTEAQERAYFLTSGRKYLPSKFRESAKASFLPAVSDAKRADLIRRIDAIVDEYVGLNLLDLDSTGFTRAKELISDYRDLLQEVMPPGGNGGITLIPQPTEDNDPRGTSQHGLGGRTGTFIIRKGAKKKGDKEETDEAIKAAKSSKEKAEKPDPQDGSGQAPDASPKSDGGEGDDPSEGDGDAQDGAGDDGGDLTPQDLERSEPDPNEAPSEGGTGVGSGGSVQGNDPIDELLDAVAEVMEDALNDPELQADLRRMAKAVESQMQNEEGFTAEMLKSIDVPSTAAEQAAVRQSVTRLKRLNLDLESERLTHQTSGRLNVRRLIETRGRTVDIFNRWDEGAESEGGVEAVVVIDVSASMSGWMSLVSSVLWIVKRAFHEANIRITVIAYSNAHYLMYRPGEKVDRTKVRRFGAVSGTTAAPAYREAFNLLARSKEANKVLLGMTDGGWGDHTEAVKVAESISAMPDTTTVLVGVGGAIYGDERRGHQRAFNLQSVEDVPRIMEGMVTTILQGVRTKHQSTQ